MKADAQEMRVCVFLKFACNVFVNTGFMRPQEPDTFKSIHTRYNTTASISTTAAGRKTFSWLIV